eukprot:m.461822 g.461822  ORF g.461822 m.461822 type:complete len:63 (+) comp22416_c0_seq1:1361-1549(+)
MPRWTFNALSRKSPMERAPTLIALSPSNLSPLSQDGGKLFCHSTSATRDAQGTQHAPPLCDG